MRAGVNGSRDQRLRLVGLMVVLSSGACGGRTGLELGDVAGSPLGGSGGGVAEPTQCPTTFADCDQNNVCETDLAASNENCGACGNVCPEGLVCGAGVCRSPEDIIQVAAGNVYTCALRASGEVLCWGSNFSGVLGDGTLEAHATPMAVEGLADAVEIDANTAQDPHETAMCARRAMGAVMCWGSGAHGQLGSGSEQDEPVPVEVAGVTKAASVRATFASACVLLRDGSVWCWGENTFGELGDGTGESRLTAAPVVNLEHAIQLDVGGLGCATLPPGDWACWGYDKFGLTGTIETILNAPSTIGGLHDVASIHLPGPASNLLPGTQCFIHADGTASCTGENDFGTVDIDIPHDVTNGEWRAVEGVTDAIQVAGTLSTTCALRANGQVLCWGTNNTGLLGIGSFEQPDEKVVSVTGLSGVLHLAGGRGHMCAALGAGGVACWGNNLSGQLGDGTTVASNSPVYVVGLP